jgi:hypothetical protein
VRETVNQTVGRIVRGIALCALLAAVSAPASAEPPRPAGENRWIPSVAFYSGTTIQKWSGGYDSSCEVGGPGNLLSGLQTCNFWVLPNTSGPLRPEDQNSSDLAVSPLVGFNLQLMSPAITAVPGRPRIYIFGESQLTFSTDRDVASEGDPAGVGLPDTVDFPQQASALSLTGVGSKTTGTYQTAGWGAGVGIAFPFKIFRRQLWVKPNAAWMRYKVAIDGKVVGGIKNDYTTLPPRPPYGTIIRDVTLKSSTEEYYNGIGGGLEIEMDAYHFGPLGISIFLNGNAYKILGERETRMSDTRFYSGDGLPASNYTANWRFEVDPWIYRIGGGIRFGWVGD